VDAFRAKRWLNPIAPPASDPYGGNGTAPNGTAWGPDAVCAINYLGDASRQTYVTYTFANAAAARANGSFVTHLRPCGLCSSTVDLAVYLGSPDLTNPVRKCGLKGAISRKWAISCLTGLGFSPSCALIWYYNTVNTRKNCLEVCLKYINAPNNEGPNGPLNPCLQCDEDKSGPVFKRVSGRTRRGSGLLSAIWRPPSTVANITHFYY
jgi:hypothetical protein